MNILAVDDEYYSYLLLIMALIPFIIKANSLIIERTNEKQDFVPYMEKLEKQFSFIQSRQLAYTCGRRERFYFMFESDIFDKGNVGKLT